MPKASGAEEPLGQREQSNSPGAKHNGELRRRLPCLWGARPLQGGQVPPWESPLLLRKRPSLWKGKLRHRAGAPHQAWGVLTQILLPGRSLVTCAGRAEGFGVPKSVLWGWCRTGLRQGHKPAWMSPVAAPMLPGDAVIPSKKVSRALCSMPAPRASSKLAAATCHGHTLLSTAQHRRQHRPRN